MPEECMKKFWMLQRKKEKVQSTIQLEIENISLREFMLKYPVISKEETALTLRGLLKSKGISIKYVQEYLGLACVQSVYQWLDGKKLPSLDNLYALSQLLQVSMDELVSGNKQNLKSIWEENFFKRMVQYEQMFVG